MTPFRMAPLPWGALALRLLVVVVLGTLGGVYLAIDRTAAPKVAASYLPSLGDSPDFARLRVQAGPD